MIRARAAFVVSLVFLVNGCSACLGVGDLEAKGSDPRVDRDERCIALYDALKCDDPAVPRELSARAETLLVAEGTPEGVKKDREVALDIVAALSRAPELSAPVLSGRLRDPRSPYQGSKEALEFLARHPDPTVKELARARLEALASPK